jgi:hypothetical protein
MKLTGEKLVGLLHQLLADAPESMARGACQKTLGQLATNLGGAGLLGKSVDYKPEMSGAGKDALKSRRSKRRSVGKEVITNEGPAEDPQEEEKPSFSLFGGPKED